MYNDLKPKANYMFVETGSVDIGENWEKDIRSDIEARYEYTDLEEEYISEGKKDDYSDTVNLLTEVELINDEWIEAE